jgi:quercetin dioxygenase-like cupin family protein
MKTDTSTGTKIRRVVGVGNNARARIATRRGATVTCTTAEDQDMARPSHFGMDRHPTSMRWHDIARRPSKADVLAHLKKLGRFLSPSSFYAGSAALLLAVVCSAGLRTGAIADEQLPPGVSIAAHGEFAPPEGLGTFKTMTFVIDVVPGSGFPPHSHPGKSEVMILQGELTEHKPGGSQKVYRAGDSFIEEPNAVHDVKNTGKDVVRLVWTLLLPDGTDPIVLSKQ